MHTTTPEFISIHGMVAGQEGTNLDYNLGVVSMDEYNKNVSNVFEQDVFSLTGKDDSGKIYMGFVSEAKQ